MHTRNIRIPAQLILLVATLICFGQFSVNAWRAARAPLMTRWAREVSPSNAWPEYPRPQLVRDEWLNLNGLWNYAIVSKSAPRPTNWDGQILVPFPVESALSGVMKPLTPANRLWYQRSFELPSAWKGRRVRLNFGAVDWETEVYVNGRRVGSHRGGYDAFSFDITDELKPAGNQEVTVVVFDPTDSSTQPHGKQVLHPQHIYYTASSGIWQTVWLEPVARTHIESVRIVPDLDNEFARLAVTLSKPTQGTVVQVALLDGEKTVGRQEVHVGNATSGEIVKDINLPVPQAKPWSPDHPFLYHLKFTVTQGGRVVDEVRSYFGMRKISLGKDRRSVVRLFLNNRPLFEFGPLDQGFWPDGLYTAPTDEALRYDIEVMKRLGFNLARKHVKVEPARWYYWCDKLGLLVWQDMPSGDRHIGRHDPDIQRTPESAKEYVTELHAIIQELYDHPSIVMWIPFNEGWGQFDTARIVNLVKQWDPTRLVDAASGWADRGVGDMHDIHKYPGPAIAALETHRAVVLGEFGGLGLPIRDHTLQEEKNWGYRSYKNPEELTTAYSNLLDKLYPLINQGLAAAVYTQLTDVETEVNGLMTYDRAVIKMDPTTVSVANKKVFTPAGDNGH